MAVRSARSGSAAAKHAPALAPSVISLYAGAVGASKTLEACGQRDEPAVAAFGAAVTLRAEIGAAAVERHARELAQALLAGLKKIDGVKIWTDGNPERSAAVIAFQPAALDARALGTALYERDRIAARRAEAQIGPACGSRRTSTTHMRT